MLKMPNVHGKQYQKLLRLLIQCRQRQGMSQSEVSRALKKPRPYANKVEAGERRLDVAEFVTYCKAIDADPVAIITKFVK